MHQNTLGGQRDGYGGSTNRLAVRRGRHSFAEGKPAADDASASAARELSPAPRRSARLALAQQGKRTDRLTSPARGRSRTPGRTRAAAGRSPEVHRGKAIPSASARAVAATTTAVVDAYAVSHSPVAAALNGRDLLTRPATESQALLSPTASPLVSPRRLGADAAAGLQYVPRRQRRGWASRSQSAIKVAWEHALLSYDDIPHWMRDNCLIRTQYRPQMTVRQALASLFTLHNETFNTWSHVAGAVIMLLRMLMFSQLAPPPAPTLATGATHPHPPKWPIYLLLAANFYVYCVSASAHLLHVIGKGASDLLWRLDHTAIAVSCTAAFVPVCIFAFECRQGLEVLYCSVTCFLAVCVMVTSSLDFFHQPKFRSARAAVQLLFPLWAQVPLVHMAYLLYPHPEAVTALLTIGGAIGIMVLGAGIFASRIPERLLPAGSVDVIGSSHNIMHVLVVVSHLVFTEAAQKLWLWRGGEDGMCPPHTSGH